MIVQLRSPLSDVAADRFVSVARNLNRSGGSICETDWRRYLDQEIAWCRDNALLNGSQLAYEASIRVLLDLARLGWQVREEGYGVELVAPSSVKGKLSPEQVLAEKQKTRAVFQPLVEAQFRHPSVRDFIKRMEEPTAASKKKPVQLLIADGSEIHARLLASGTGAVQPYLQLVDGETRDEFTGHSLREIWRYFRYSWSIPQFATPGRQLLYLVRDAAHPSHAVMGIIGLNNCALQMGAEREAHLGWNFETVCSRLADIAQNSPPQLAREWDWMEAQIESALADVEKESLATDEEVREPDDAVIAKLRRRAKEFDSLRDETLREFASVRSGTEMLGNVAEAEDFNYAHPPVSEEMLAFENKPSTKPGMQKARRHLIARKRASLLAELLHARMTLHKHKQELTDSGHLAQALADENVKVAINTVLAALKSRFAGVNMLEISTCGAIPPYNHILGGKLASLLLFSPQIAADYRRIYGGPSIIASQIKNQPVHRPNELVFLGTTSLYAQGSSQYERLRLPAGTVSDDQPELRFQRIGRTSGYGTLQFPAETRQAVEAHLVSVQRFHDINSIFGEGPSPKLRKLVAGLRAIGFPPDSLMRHNRPRLIYAASLCPQSLDFLNARPCGLPSYVREPEQFANATERIIAFWKSRWLEPRLRHEPSTVGLLSARPWKLGDKLPSDQPAQPLKALEKSLKTETDSEKSLWRSLAASGKHVTSDSLAPEELERLHVETPVEDFIRAKIGEGFSIFLTGNAGDGKTHLLKRLAQPLRASGADIVEDASDVMRQGDRGKGDVTPLLDRWRSAVTTEKPFCVAINEYPLYLLIQAAREHLPEHAAELERQIRTRIVYGPISEADEARCKILVVDLSLRNPLRADFALPCLQKILADPQIIAKATKGTSLGYNVERLSHPLIQERLLNLFERLADMGFHATVRELWIVLSRMVLGYRSDLVEREGEGASHWYSESLFQNDKRFGLFEKLAALCDPSNVSHPVYDFLIEEASPELNSGWTFGPPRPVAAARPERKEFCALKRAFYLEHSKGDRSFCLENEDARKFQRVLRETTDNDIVARRELVASVNRAFCPVPFSGADENLYLWSGHRFQEQTSQVFLANQRLSIDRITLSKPRLPTRVQQAIPDYKPDHIAIAFVDNRRFMLKIDANLFITFCKLARGLPRKLMEEGDLFRIEAFVEYLTGLGFPSDRQVLSSDLTRREVIEVHMSADSQRYERVIRRTSR